MAIQKRVLLIISGGIAAYKSLDLIRILTDSGIDVRCILTRSGTKFITPLSVETLSKESESSAKCRNPQQSVEALNKVWKRSAKCRNPQ